MGHWTSGGEYVPGKLEVVQIEKNRVRKRANLSEHAMRRIRSVIDNAADESDTDILESVIDALEDWETDMERLNPCGAEHDGVFCKLLPGHKSRHVGTDGQNKRHDWSVRETQEAAS